MEDSGGKDLLRILTCALVERLEGTNSVARMGLGNIHWAGMQG